MIFKSRFLLDSFYFIIFFESVLSYPNTNKSDDTEPMQNDQRDLSEFTFPPDYLLFQCRISANMNTLSQYRKSKETMKHIRKEIYLLKSSKFATDTLMEIVSELAQTVKHRTAQIAILTLAETTSNILGKVTVRNFVYLLDYYKMLKAKQDLLKVLNRVIQELVNIYRDPLGRRLLLALLNAQTNKVSGLTVKNEPIENLDAYSEPGKNIEFVEREIEENPINSTLNNKEDRAELEKNQDTEGLPSVTVENQIDQPFNLPNREDENSTNKKNKHSMKNGFHGENESDNLDLDSPMSLEKANESDSLHHSEIGLLNDEGGKNIEETNFKSNEKILNNDEELLKLVEEDEEKSEPKIDYVDDLQEPTVTMLAKSVNLDDLKNLEDNKPIIGSEFITEKEEMSNAVNIREFDKNTNTEENISVAVTLNTDQKEDYQSYHRKSKPTVLNTNEINIESDDQKTDRSANKKNLGSQPTDEVQPITNDVISEKRNTPDIYKSEEHEEIISLTKNSDEGKSEPKIDYVDDLQEPTVTKLAKSINLDDLKDLEDNKPIIGSEFITEKEEMSNAVSIREFDENTNTEENISVAITLNTDQKEDDQSYHRKSKPTVLNTNEINIESDDQKTDRSANKKNLGSQPTDEVQPITNDMISEKSNILELVEEDEGKSEPKIDYVDDLQEPTVTKLAKSVNLDDLKNLEDNKPIIGSEFITEKEEMSNAINIREFDKNTNTEENISAAVTLNTDQKENHQSYHRKSKPTVLNTNEINIESDDQKTDKSANKRNLGSQPTDEVQPITKDVISEKSNTPDIYKSEEHEEIISLTKNSDTITTMKEGISSKETNNGGPTVNENMKENTSKAISVNERNYTDESLGEIPEKIASNKSRKNPGSNLQISSSDQEIMDDRDKSQDKPIVPIESSDFDNVLSESLSTTRSLENDLITDSTMSTNTVNNAMSKEVVAYEEFMQNENNTSAAVIYENKSEADTTIMVKKYPQGKKFSKAVAKTNETINKSLITNEEQKDIEKDLDLQEIKGEIKEDAIANNSNEDAFNDEIVGDKFEPNNNYIPPDEAISNSNEISMKRGHQGEDINIQNNITKEEESNSVLNPINEEISLTGKEVGIELGMVQDSEIEKYNSEEMNEVIKLQLESQDGHEKEDEENHSTYKNTFDNLKSIDDELIDSLINAKHIEVDERYENSHPDTVLVNEDGTLINRTRQLAEKTTSDLAKQSEERESSNHYIVSNSDTGESISNLAVSKEFLITSAELEKQTKVEEKKVNIPNIDHSNEEKSQKILKEESSIEIKSTSSTIKPEETKKILKYDDISINKDHASLKVSKSFDGSEEEVFTDISKQEKDSLEIKERAVLQNTLEQFALTEVEKISATTNESDSIDEKFIEEPPLHNQQYISSSETHDKITTTDSLASVNQEVHNEALVPKDNVKLSNLEEKLETVQETSDTLSNGEFGSEEVETDEEDPDFNSEYGHDVEISDKSTISGELDGEDEDDSGIEDDHNIQSIEENIIDIESDEIEIIPPNPKFTLDEGHFKKDTENVDTNTTGIKNEYTLLNDDKVDILTKNNVRQEPEKLEISIPTQDTSSLQPSDLKYRPTIDSDDTTLKETLSVRDINTIKSTEDENISKNTFQSVTSNENIADPLLEKTSDRIVSKEKNNINTNLLHIDQSIVDNVAESNLETCRLDTTEVLENQQFKQPIVSIENSSDSNSIPEKLSTIPNPNYEPSTDSENSEHSHSLKSNEKYTNILQEEICDNNIQNVEPAINEIEENAAETTKNVEEKIHLIREALETAPETDSTQLKIVETEPENTEICSILNAEGNNAENVISPNHVAKKINDEKMDQGNNIETQEDRKGEKYEESVSSTVENSAPKQERKSSLLKYLKIWQ